VPLSQPLNDQCDNAYDLGPFTDGWSQTVTGQTNIGATNDSSESPLCRVDAQHGVWYKLSITFPAEVTISTCNQADFVTQIAVYSGACESLICEADVDSSGSCETTTRVIDDVPPQDIYILVRGLEGATGNFNMTVSVAVLADDLCPNDDSKLDPGFCGCGVPDVDTNGNNQMDCTECGFGTLNTATNECDCNSKYLGGPGYCRDNNGKCTIAKIVDSVMDILYCPGSTPPSQTACRSQEMCQEVFAGAICLYRPSQMGAYCAASDACVHGVYNAATRKCLCDGSGSKTEGGFCIHVDTGACTLPKEVASIDAFGTTVYRCPPQVVHHAGRKKKSNGI